ncbi:hypothetical protein ES703_66589 [subsurface metagenome]
MLADIEVVAFYLDLGGFNGAVDPLVLDGGVFVHAHPAQDGLDAVAAETARDIVF